MHIQTPGSGPDCDTLRTGAIFLSPSPGPRGGAGIHGAQHTLMHQEEKANASFYEGSTADGTILISDAALGSAPEPLGWDPGCIRY